MRKSALLAIFSALLCLPSSSFAGIRTVDDSEYGQQSFSTNCSGFFADLAGSGAKCFKSEFSSPFGFRQGYLVGWDTPVRDVDITFTNVADLATPGLYGLVVCSDPNIPCDGTPTWDLDITNFLPTYQSLFSETVGGTHTITFSLSGLVQAAHVQGHEVAFLVLSDTQPTITVRPRPACAVALTFASGTLNVGFTLQSPTAATWRTWVAGSNGVFNLWAIPIPILPAVSFNIPLAGVPSIGLVGILNQLTTAQGTTCFDFKSVNSSP